MNYFDVSVVIPCFNSSNTIIRALRSIEKQTVKPVEVIVVDDLSTDDTVEKINQYIKTSQLNIHLYKNDINKGPGYARNSGLSKIKSTWVAFLDSDDEWMSNKLERDYKLLTQRNGDFIGGGYPSKDKSKLPKVVSKSMLLFKNYFWTSTITMRYSTSLLFSEETNHSEDYYMILKAAMMGYKMLYEPDVPIIEYKSPLGEQGLSKNIVKMHMGVNIISDQLIKENVLTPFQGYFIMLFERIKFFIRKFNYNF